MQDKVRLAEVGDIDALINLGREFHAESPYSDTNYDEIALAEFLLRGMRSMSTEIFVAVDDGTVVGAACVSMTKMYFSADTYFATELFWFVASNSRGKRAGIDLLKAMEVWSAAKGCKFLSVISFRGKAPQKYTPIETTYYRRLN